MGARQVEVPAHARPGDLQQCGTCGRKFNPASFEKHARVCQRVFVEKKKPVDMK